MTEKQDTQFEHEEETVSESPEEPTDPTVLPTPPHINRPRDTERKVQAGQEKTQQRPIRSTLKSRGLESPARPRETQSGSIEHLEKFPLESRTIPVKENVKLVGVLEDRETVKWAAYGALLASVVTIILLILYSQRDFSPAFEYYDLKIMQDQLDKRMNSLEYTSQLERIRNAILNAQIQVFVQKDPEAAEVFLVQAKEELNSFIETLPIEETTKPKEIMGDIDQVLREIRRPPSPLQQEFRGLLMGLEKL